MSVLRAPRERLIEELDLAIALHVQGRLEEAQAVGLGVAHAAGAAQTDLYLLATALSGECARAMEDLGAAHRLFREVVSLHVRLAEYEPRWAAHVGAARVRSTLGLVEMYRLSLVGTPSDYGAALEMIHDVARGHEIQGAEDAYRYGLAMVYRCQGRFEEAIALLRRRVTSAPAAAFGDGTRAVQARMIAYACGLPAHSGTGRDDLAGPRMSWEWAMECYLDALTLHDAGDREGAVRAFRSLRAVDLHQETVQLAKAHVAARLEPRTGEARYLKALEVSVAGSRSLDLPNLSLLLTHAVNVARHVPLDGDVPGQSARIVAVLWEELSGQAATALSARGITDAELSTIDSMAAAWKDGRSAQPSLQVAARHALARIAARISP